MMQEGDITHLEGIPLLLTLEKTAMPSPTPGNFDLLLNDLVEDTAHVQEVPTFLTRYYDVLKQTGPSQYAIYRSPKHGIGWGNRIRGIFSMFVLALLTHRKLVIDDAIFDSYFSSYTINQTDQFPVLLRWDIGLMDGFCHSSTDTFLLDKQLLKQKIDLKKILDSHRCVEYSQPAAFDTELVQNPHFRQTIEGLFGTLSRLTRIRMIGSYLMARPTTAFLDAVNKAKQEMEFDRYDRHVAVQLRVMYDIPAVMQRNLRTIESYWECVEEILSKSVGIDVGPHTSLIFFTTDYPPMRQAAKLRLSKFGDVRFISAPVQHTEVTKRQLVSGNLLIESLNGMNHHDSHDDGHESTYAFPNQARQVLSALVDWFLLGDSDLLLTSGSTFGLSAFSRPSYPYNWDKEQGRTLYNTPHETYGYMGRYCGRLPGPRSMHPETDIIF